MFFKIDIVTLMIMKILYFLIYKINRVNDTINHNSLRFIINLLYNSYFRQFLKRKKKRTWE